MSLFGFIGGIAALLGLLLALLVIVASIAAGGVLAIPVVAFWLGVMWWCWRSTADKSSETMPAPIQESFPNFQRAPEPAHYVEDTRPDSLT